MENIRLFKTVKMKSVQKNYIGAIMAFVFTFITVFSGAINVHAETWSATLPAATGIDRGRTYTCTEGVKKQMSLTRIQDGPSYYVRAQMINSNGDPRTDETLFQQNAGLKDFTNNQMASTYKYQLLVGNEHFETTSRAAYGYIYI